VAADDREPPRLLLWTLDGDELRDIGIGGTRLRQSTTVNGPWVGTTQLELVGDQMAPLRSHADHRVRVTGVLDAQDGTTGFVDQVQNAYGAEFRQLRVTRFEMVEGACVVHPHGR
jgi:hypothetical protein